ncbi:hypothetical protein [Cryobacterium tepidiphilum]|uniref:Uncharacterized protein n=1 Tax=Cryobacterium tepidiphilum TaxID=2486026 RepID=A0A3M8LEB1_9MICO|nr:hypothetical protein [Cryobacterium tepidiphilum]RNE63811.1 hypothetical protein EEJ31_06190 [Cryobacterium tepidiphilum]
MNDTDPNSPETGAQTPTTETPTTETSTTQTPTTDAAAPAPTPPADAEGDVLRDEIESIHAIGEDQ